MVDRILLECLKYAIKPDIILFNGAIDAYIRYVTAALHLCCRYCLTKINDSVITALNLLFDRCGRTQKAIDLFDAVISKPDNNINNDKKSYSNKEKNEIIEISKAFTNKNLQPNIRTYNTVLKALRGYTGFEKCMDVIKTMKANDINPDTVTMNTLIDAAVVSGNLDIANDVSQFSSAQ